MSQFIDREVVRSFKEEPRDPPHLGVRRLGEGRTSASEEGVSNLVRASSVNSPFFSVTKIIL